MGLHCCAQAFSSCGKWGLLFVALHRLLTAVTSRCRARALGTWASVVVACGLTSCGLWALEHRLSSMVHGLGCSVACGWDLPGPGLEPVSPVLAGRFLTTAPPGKPLEGDFFFFNRFFCCGFVKLETERKKMDTK